MDQLKLFVDLVLHGRYKITRQLGRGGMGAVYEATDLQEKRQVAIKQMLPADPDLRLAFKREALILSQITHPGLPHAFDFFENETGIFIAMDFIAGDNLGQLLASRGIPFAPHQVKRWAEDLLQILIFLHSQSPRIIHRDIKPTNLKLTPQGRIVLLDFGLAKKIDETSDLITNICILAYTPHYAPLEQIQGESTNLYSDIYALGACLYHLLTGIPPTDALKRANHILCKKQDPLPQINHLVQGVPQSLASLVMKALSLAPSDRPASASQMLQQLQAGIITPLFKPATSSFPLPGNSSAPSSPLFTQPIPHHLPIDATYGYPAFAEITLVSNQSRPSPQSSHSYLTPLPTRPVAPVSNKAAAHAFSPKFQVHFPQPPPKLALAPKTRRIDHRNHQPGPATELQKLRFANAKLQQTNTTLLNYARTASSILILVCIALISALLSQSNLNPLRSIPPTSTSQPEIMTNLSTRSPDTTTSTKLSTARARRRQSQPNIFIKDSPQPLETITVEDFIRREIIREQIQKLKDRLPRQPKPSSTINRNSTTSL